MVNFFNLQAFDWIRIELLSEKTLKMADEEAGETVEKELTAKQRKNRKKKEAAKRKKQEQSLKVSHWESLFWNSPFARA